MKAAQLMARKVGCLVVEPLAQASQGMPELEDLVVVDREPTPIRAITDRELASAAFTQAVALYDSCIRCAMAAQLALKPGRAHVRSVRS